MGDDRLSDQTWAVAEGLGYSRAEAEEEKPQTSVVTPRRAEKKKPSRAWSPVVEIQGGAKERRPLFFVHPVGGNVFCYVELARALGAEQPFYGLQSRGLDGRHVPLSLVSDMAACYAEALRAVQPAGPYMLGGWSMGGVIAYEMARQLAARGDEVSLLALVDSHAPAARERERQENPLSLLYTFGLDLGLGMEELRAALADDGGANGDYEKRLGRLLEVGTASRRLPPDLDPEQLGRLFNVFRVNSRAVTSYAPERTEARVTLFKATEPPPKVNANGANGRGGAGRALAERWRAWREDQTLGWRRLSAGVEVSRVPGHHFSVVRPPHVAALADGLRTRILQSSRQENP